MTSEKKDGWKLKRIVKAALILMAILTAIYVCAVVYANDADTNANDYANDYPPLTYGTAAFEYESDTPPTVWYTPEELGIVGIIECGENRSVLQIIVDKEKEPFPLQSKEPLTRFLYKDKFYTVSYRWVTFTDPCGSGFQWQMPLGITLGVGWIITGVLTLKWRKAQ